MAGASLPQPEPSSSSPLDAYQRLRGCCPNAVCCCRCASAKRGSFISRRNSAFHRDATTPKRAKTGLGNTPLILDTSLRSTLHPSKPAAVMDSAIHKITERPGSHLCFRGLSRPPAAIGVTAFPFPNSCAATLFQSALALSFALRICFGFRDSCFVLRSATCHSFPICPLVAPTFTTFYVAPVLQYSNAPPP
jgi:hypothetical protein